MKFCQERPARDVRLGRLRNISAHGSLVGCRFFSCSVRELGEFSVNAKSSKAAKLKRAAARRTIASFSKQKEHNDGANKSSESKPANRTTSVTRRAN